MGYELSLNKNELNVNLPCKFYIVRYNITQLKIFLRIKIECFVFLQTIQYKLIRIINVKLLYFVCS